jgi:hypothetical protein
MPHCLERDLNDPLHYAHRGEDSAVRSGSNDSTKSIKTFDDRIKDLVQAFKEELGHCNVSPTIKLRQEAQISIPWKMVQRYKILVQKDQAGGGRSSHKLSDVKIHTVTNTATNIDCLEVDTKRSRRGGHLNIIYLMPISSALRQ